jgi:starch phosphorylase
MGQKIPTAVDIGLEDVRTGSSVEALKQAYLDNLFYIQGKFRDVATPHDLYMAAAYSVRDRVMERWIKMLRAYKASGARTVCYLSAEFLVGPHLANNLVNLGLDKQARQAAAELGLDAQEILDQEEEPGLGNGGLGRLAACYMDSLATLQIPSIGYGIRYEFGIFDQEINDGWQTEISDLWLRNGNPWELPRPKLRFPVRFGGHTEHTWWSTGLPTTHPYRVTASNTPPCCACGIRKPAARSTSRPLTSATTTAR